MRLKAIIVALAIGCVTTVGAADLKDMFNRAKEKAVETLKKETNVPDSPAAQPAQESESLPSVSLQPASSGKQVSNATGKPSAANKDELWPNLAVDDGVVK